MKISLISIWNTACDLRVLAGVAFVLFVASVSASSWTFLTKSGMARAREHRRAELTSGPVETGASSPTPGSASSRMLQNSPKTLFLSLREAKSKASGQPSRVPGDLLADLSTIFEKGDESGLVGLRTNEEIRIFEGWRRVLGHCSMQGLLLRRLATAPNLVRYDVRIHGTSLNGEIALSRVGGRWYLVGFSQKKIRDSGVDEQTLRLLEMMRRGRGRGK